MKIKVTSVSVADQPAAMLYTDDFKGDYERIEARGAKLLERCPHWHGTNSPSEGRRGR